MTAMNARIIVAVAAAGLFFGTMSLGLAEEKPIRIGVLNDMSGPYADYQGPGSVLAAQMAVEDYGGKAAGRKVEVLSADHQNKPDAGLGIVRKWIDEDGVDMIADVPNSAVALAISQLVKDKNKAFIGSGAGTAALTGAQCSPNTVQWTYDTWELGHALGRAIVEQGKKNWYFIATDYAFGHDLEKQASEAVIEGGGKVLGVRRRADRHGGFFVVPFAGGIGKPGCRGAGERRRRSDDIGETGRGIRPHPEGDARRIRPDHPKYSGADVASDAGDADGQCLVLGPERCDARVVASL